MQLFQVRAEPCPRIVGEHALGLLPDPGSQRCGARGVVGRVDGLRPGNRGRVPGRPSAGSRRQPRLRAEAPSRSGAASSRRRRAARPRAPRSCGSRADDRGRPRCRGRSLRRSPGPLHDGCAAAQSASAAPCAGGPRAGRAARPGASPARPRPRARAARCPAGNFSCQSPFPFSTRCRSVTPRRASRWSAVSW